MTTAQSTFRTEVLTYLTTVTLPHLKSLANADLKNKLANIMDLTTPAVPSTATIPPVPAVRKPVAKKSTQAKPATKPMKTTKATKPTKTTKATKKKVAGEKRSPEELKSLVENVHATIAGSKAAGIKMEALGKQLNMTTAELTLPIKKLFAAKRIRSEGQKRATTYFAH